MAERPDDQQRQRDDRHGSRASTIRPERRRGREAPHEQRDDARDGDSVEDREPRDAAVGSRHQPVEEARRPDREVEVVRLPPEAIRQPLPVVVRDRERDEELGGGDPEAGPERAVGRRERDEELDERERQERVDRDGQDVDADQRADEQAAEAVDVLDREARPAAALRLASEREPEADDDAEDDVRRDARRARRVPDRRARAHVHAAPPPSRCATQAFSTISPSTRDEAAGDAALVEPRPARVRRAGSRPSRRRPRRGSVAPEAVTCSQRRLARRGPSSVSTRCAPRDAVPLVARPPLTTRIAPPAGSATSTGPRTARSPPTETKPGRRESAAASSTAERLHDAVQVEREPRRAGEQPLGQSRPPRQRPQSVGSTRPSVSAATSSATAQRAREERRDGEHARRRRG